MLHGIPLTDHRFYPNDPTELYLYKEGLTDRDILDMIVPFLKEHPEITSLNVNRNSIGDEGAKAIALIHSLTTINIRQCHVGDIGAKSFAIKKNLVYLDIRDNNVGDIGIKALATNKKILTLHALYHDNYTEERNEILKETDPVILANYRKEAGLDEFIKIPSLTKIGLHKVKKENLDQSKLPKDLQDKLSESILKQVIKKFEGNPIYLLNKNQLAGLGFILKTETEHFKSENIMKFEQIVENGKLKGVRMYCNDDPSCLRDAIGDVLKYSNLSTNAFPYKYSIDIDPVSLENIKWLELMNKFSNSPDKLEAPHFESLAKIDTLLSKNEGFLPAYNYEQRLARYKQGKKDGPLETIMVKFSLCSDSKSSALKTVDDFETYINRLKERLGEDNFNRLVKRHGAAATGYDEKTGTPTTMYIEFKADELAKGFERDGLRPKL